MVLIICFAVAVIRRLLQTIDSNMNIPFAVVFLHVLFSSLYGLGNSIVYGLTPRVKKEWKRRISDWKKSVFGVNIMKGGEVNDIDMDVEDVGSIKTAVSTY